MADKVHIVKGQNEQFYWHRSSENGQIVATGGEGYTRREDATEAAGRENPGAEIVVETEEEE